VPSRSCSHERAMLEDRARSHIGRFRGEPPAAAA
jgi:hypothetical protein